MSDTYYYKCQCYQVGGPFVAEDPECPEHGYAAQRRDEIENEDKENIRAELAAWREMFPQFKWDTHMQELIEINQ